MSSDLSDKIIKQVEYYFGDINLNKDKFLQEEIQKDSGWVTLETLIKFNRLKQLSTDFQFIIDSLKKSESNLLEIDEENKKVRRAKPLPENLSEFETNLKQNTVYVKGFPSDLTLDQLYSHFEQYGKVLQIFMRRFPTTRQFKGSCFVTFATKEEMQSFLDLAEVKYNEQVLSKESQEAYLERKAPELEKIKDSKKKKEQQKEDRLKQKQEAEEAYFKEQQVLGAVLHLKGLSGDNSRESLKELFDNYARVKYVDYSKGQTEGYVRFSEENEAKVALDKFKEANNGECVVKETKVECRILEGEEEQTYWRELIRRLAEHRNKNKNKSKNRRGKNQKGGKKSGKYNKNKRALGEDGDEDDEDDDAGEGDEENGAEENTNKKQKTEDN